LLFITARGPPIATVAPQQSSSTTTVSAPVLPAAPIQHTALPPELGRMVPIQITLPPQPGSGETQARVLNIQVPAAALQGKRKKEKKYI
jgi:hypothetical protein